MPSVFVVINIDASLPFSITVSPVKVKLLAVTSPVLVTLNGAVAKLVLFEPLHILPLASTWNDVASEVPASSPISKLDLMLASLKTALPSPLIFQPVPPNVVLAAT